MSNKMSVQKFIKTHHDVVVDIYDNSPGGIFWGEEDEEEDSYDIFVRGFPNNGDRWDSLEYRDVPYGNIFNLLGQWVPYKGGTMWGYPLRLEEDMAVKFI